MNHKDLFKTIDVLMQVALKKDMSPTLAATAIEPAFKIYKSNKNPIVSVDNSQYQIGVMAAQSCFGLDNEVKVLSLEDAVYESEDKPIFYICGEDTFFNNLQHVNKLFAKPYNRLLSIIVLEYFKHSDYEFKPIWLEKTGIGNVQPYQFFYTRYNEFCGEYEDKNEEIKMTQELYKEWRKKAKKGLEEKEKQEKKAIKMLKKKHADNKSKVRNAKSK